MSLLSSLFTGVSGLQTFGASMQVIGNNIANVSTIGFKGARTEFSALFSDFLGQSDGIGRGVEVDKVTTSFSQGSFSNTDRLTDLAIDGNGFFVLNNGEAKFYTRNGQFALDNEGFLVNSAGFKVQGQVFDISGVSQGSGDLQLGKVNAPPRPTSDGVTGDGVLMNVNLDSRATIPAAFDSTTFASAEATSNFSTTITVFDSKGVGHAATVYFRKSVEGSPGVDSEWEWHAMIDGSEIEMGAAGTPDEGASGTLKFNDSGALVSQTTTASDFDFTGGVAQDQNIGFDFGDDIAGGGTGLAGSTSFGSSTVVNTQSQDGFAAGTLSGFSIAPDGTISGFFTNGQNLPVGQIELATFRNVQGLAPIANSLFRETIESGVPLIGTAAKGGFGAIATNTLELSNVDLANEFVNLVTTQRAFQANTRIITTVDQLLNDVVNIIR